MVDPSVYELTLVQQFEYRLMELSAENMTAEEARDLLVQASRLLMIKENVIKSLLKKMPVTSL